MTAEVRSAIEEARDIVLREHRATREQEEADLRFARMFQDCANFLEGTSESRVPNLGMRRFWGFMQPIVAPLFLIPGVQSRITRIPINDLADQRRLTASLNGTGEPISVTLASETAVPSQTGSINLQITGLPEQLRLVRTHAEILCAGVPQGAINSFIRKANLRDAARFQPVVDGLTKPHA